jgi:glycosyltransferase involved in cell wall biosynthesis
MSKVVFFANSTWGIYNFRLNLVKALLQKGCEVHVLAPLDPNYDNNTFIAGFKELGVIFHAVPLHPRGRNPFRELHSVFSLYKLLRSLKPDVVLSYTVKCNLYAGFCRQLIGFRQVANVPGLGEVFERKDTIYALVCALYRIAFRGITTVFFQNSEDLKYCLEARLVAPDHCILIPGSGVDLNKFQVAFPPRGGSRRVFLMFGRTLPQKGYMEYLQAAEQLRRSFGNYVECWVMGIEDKNRPESVELYRKIREFAARGVIRLIPSVADVVPILRDVDTVVLPSRYNEGIPRSLLEAMAMGKIIITTDWRGCRDTVDQGKNGFLVQTNNISNLVNAMERVVQMDDVGLRAMGMHSRKIVENRYDEQLVVSEYMRVTIGHVEEEDVRKVAVGEI